MVGDPRDRTPTDRREVVLARQENVVFSSFLPGLSAPVIVRDSSDRNALRLGISSGRESDTVGACILTHHALAVTDKYPSRWHNGHRLYSKQPGALSFLPAGFNLRLRPQTPFRFLVCFLDPAVLSEVESELDHYSSEELYPKTNFHDIGSRQLVSLLFADATSEAGRWEQLYRDHLVHALALRIISLKGTTASYNKAFTPLPYRLLRRVLERMNEFDDSPTLQELATESGYSRDHFSRMFQAATGRTPHNYLTHLRLERAQELLKMHKASLIDVALACGFSSHSHMARVFRKFLGVTPSEFQRCHSTRNVITHVTDIDILS